MIRKLLSYVLNGKILGIEQESWSADELNGNKPFIYILEDDVIPQNYVDISSIVNWYRFGGNCVKDYLAIQREIRNISFASVWDELTTQEKDILIELYAFKDDVEAIIYLMFDKGMSETEARMFILKNWHIHHGNMTQSCRDRWFEVKFTVGMFLPTSSAEHLFQIAQLLIFSFTDCAIFGKNYGDSSDGLMDFIESTNGYVNNGLTEQGYTLNFGTYEIFISELKKVLVNGIY